MGRAKPRVFYGRFTFDGPSEWCVVHRGRVIATGLTWRAAVDLALTLTE